MTKARTLADNFAADISGVTAGTGITGGGTSGTVTITNSMATAIDAKGDLLVGTGADTFSRLAVASTAGYLLSVDSAESTGLKWAAPAAGGGYTQLASGSLSGASISLTSISGSYKELRLIISNFKPDTDNVTIRGRFNNDTGSNYIEAQAFTSSNLAATYGQFEISPSSDNVTAQGLVILDIPNYANTTTYKWAQSRGTTNNPTTSTQLNWRQYNIFWFSTAAINRIDFFPGSGNFTSGTYELLGLN